MRATHPVACFFPKSNFMKWLCLSLLVVSLTTGCRSLNQAAPPSVPTASRAEDRATAQVALAKTSGAVLASPNALALSTGNSALVVELDEQRVYLYQGSELRAVSRISSGRSGHRTETGRFYISQKDANHRSNIYGNYVDANTGATMLSDVKAGFDPLPVGAKFQGSSMRWFQRFNHSSGRSTAMGFHTGVLPGRPASHGCIRLPEHMAKWFFQNVPSQTTVHINGVKNGVPYGTSQPKVKRQKKVHSSLKEPKPAETAPEPAGEKNPAAVPAPGNPDPPPTEALVPNN
jgi:lipoprotein-anchoring transpeptidase ErfK/SrfK